MNTIDSMHLSHISGGLAVVTNEFILVSNGNKAYYNDETLIFTSVGLVYCGELHEEVFTHEINIKLNHEFNGRTELNIMGFRLPDGAMFTY